MHEIPDIDKKGLRNFGLILGAFLVLVFGLVFPYFGGKAFPLWPWLAAIVAWVWALALPGTLLTVYRVWMRVGMAIGKVINHVVLGVVFFVIIFPMSLVMRLIGHDPMARKLDKTTATYKIPSKAAPPKNLEKPF